MTHAGSFLGTVDYCSPEQIRGEPLDGRADLYSLGCVIYHCLSGEPPYARESEIAVLQAHLNDPPPSLSPDLDGLFARAMAKDREDRYPTGAALTSDLREAIAGGAPATVRAQAPPATREHATQVASPRRRRWPWVVVALALLVAVASRGSDALGDTRLQEQRHQHEPRSVRRPGRERPRAVRVRPPGDRPGAERRSRMQGLQRRRGEANRKRRGESPEHPPAARKPDRSHRGHGPDGDPPSAEPPELDRGRPPLPRCLPVELHVSNPEEPEPHARGGLGPARDDRQGAVRRAVRSAGHESPPESLDRGTVLSLAQRYVSLYSEQSPEWQHEVSSGP